MTNGQSYTISAVQELLFLSLRSALHGKAMDLSGVSTPNQSAWQSLYDLSAGQGVLALVYDGLMTLPKEQRPPREIFLRWGISTLNLEQRYETQQRALRSLALLLQREGVRVQLLKGAGLAANYPVPSHREFGDIDIYPFGDFDKVNAIMRAAEVNIEQHISKHTNFVFEGVEIENHAGFLEVDLSRTNRAFESYLLSVTDRSPGEKIDLDEIQVAVGSPIFSAIFTICHAITHFQLSGIVIRHFCDWGTFLRSHFDRLDYVEFRRVMGENDYLKLVDTFTLICVDYLGFEIDRSLYPLADATLARRVVADTFTYENMPNLSHLPFWRWLGAKYSGFRRIMTSRWKYEATLGSEFYARLTISTKTALKSIFRRR